MIAAVVAAVAGFGVAPRAAVAAEQPVAVDPTDAMGPSQTLSGSFASAALERVMPYLVYLPPGYATGSHRYSVLYMLHGLGGSDSEWRGMGLLDAADAMIRAHQIAPLIIVLPQGDHGYWMDHAGSDHEAWGTYTARDLVAEIDGNFRTIPDREHRAIGGDSMGAHGAIQLALNHPDTFGVAGGHSLVLRPFEQAFPFFGDRTQYAQRDPMSIVPAKPDAARSLTLWIDIGDKDPWAARAALFQAELGRFGLSSEWHEWPGDHSATYWHAHLGDYLRFYDGALRWSGKRARVSTVPLIAP